MSSEVGLESSESKKSKVYTLKEISEHNTPASTWVVIHDSVYDVTKFLDEVSKKNIFVSCFEVYFLRS